MRHEALLCIETDARARQCAAQIGDECLESLGYGRRTGPRNPVVLPVAGLIEDQRNGARRNFGRGALDIRDARVLHVAEKSERHMQILGASRPAAAHGAELARPTGELLAHGLVGPEREEQPHGANASG